MTLAVLGMGPAKAAAQWRPGSRDLPGFWVGAGLGGGQFEYSCSGCVGIQRLGFAGQTSAGYSFGRRFQVAISFEGARASDGPVGIRTGVVTLLGSARIMRSSPLFLQAGVGYGHLSIAKSGVAPSTITDDGVSWVVGAGWDRPIRPGFSLVPTLTYQRLGDRGAVVDGAPSGISLSADGIHLMIAIEWHWEPITWPGAAQAH